jgi:predicted MFS family arabinose efflux permease
MVPIVVGAMVAKRFAERLIGRFGYRNVLAVNTLLLGAMIAAFSFIGPGTPHAAILVQLALFGVVNSLQFTAMNTLTLSDLGETTASSGNSLLSVVQQLSMSLGVAAAGSLLLAFNPTAAQGEALLRGFHRTYVCVGLLSMMAAWIFFQLGRYERPSGPPTPGDDG